ncbi:hypothetical protein TWF730_002042 [Orbilia blumenaviensis]|uniref:F-box domain-containing protein n=1 Tax=Orbilia blumenaviensis TaxID=1796055 RepID=A0AAV9UHU5_9PEZI
MRSMELLAERDVLSPIETLPQELVSNIIEYLEPNNVAVLARVCKRLYQAARPHVWHTLRYANGPRKRPAFSRHTLGIFKLAKAADEIGVDALGFAYVKKLVLMPGDIVTRPGLDPGLNTLLNILCDQLLEGKLKLQQVELCWGDIGPGIRTSNGATRLLKVLKEYQKLNLPKRPSIVTTFGYDFGSPTSSFIGDFPFNSFALECITRLELGVGGRDTKVPLEQAIRDIELFTNILRGTHFLEYLLMTWREYIADSPHLILETPQLEELQEAITGLKYLRGLSTCGYLFHPSFFIIPPENVKVLGLEQEVSIGWWREFAQYPFTGIECLTLDTRHPSTIISESEWLHGDEEEVIYYGNDDFNLLIGELAIRGLKRFRTYSDYFYRPDDLIELLRRNNPGVQEVVKTGSWRTW